MSDLHADTSAAATPADTPRRTTSADTSGWTGWLGFAATMTLLLGAMNIIYGLVALFNDKYYVLGPEGLLVFDLTVWGWIQLIIGVLAVVTAAALARGSQWARIVAIMLVSLNAVAQLAFMSAYPVWSLIAIAIDVLIIWAVIVHGEPETDEV